jgi:hypothetical protein
MASFASALSVLIAFLSLMVSGVAVALSVWIPSYTTAVDIATQRTPSCAEYQSRVLGLADHGLSNKEIVEALNAESLPDAKDSEWWTGDAEDGPGYDAWYEPACGSIELLLPPGLSTGDG